MQKGEKKRRLNMEQMRTLEKNYELGIKLEPERKMQLAGAPGCSQGSTQQFEARQAQNKKLQGGNSKFPYLKDSGRLI
ncbi:hypothetical protein OPV22_013997 [Ensete ventricosum]|uniref:Homeobox-leucine zipper protein n=1 Tax=Ensete ventricosum TaxID=4639 RepID=A0AAV8R559_ENSVE|nr:hypothetical protein OPV22_013997 [Ensete ventricosum]